MKTKFYIAKKKLIFSLILNAIVLFIALFVFKPFFEEIDDTNISMIAEGAFGSRDWHTLFTNAILGKVLVALQNTVPSVRWFVVIQYALIYSGYVCATYIISKHENGTVLSFIAVISTFYEMYVSLQFTKTAAFLCVVGTICFMEYSRECFLSEQHNEKNIERIISVKGKSGCVKYLFLGIFFISLGMLIRDDGILFALVPGTAAGLVELLRTKKIGKYIFCGTLVVLMFTLLYGSNMYLYNKNPNWAGYINGDSNRVKLVDSRYDALDYSKHEEELKRVGVSENDAFLILTYQFGDDNVFSYERMGEIGSSFAPKKLGYETFANLFENIVNEFKRSFTMLSGLIIVILLLIASMFDKRKKEDLEIKSDIIYKLLGMFTMGGACAMALVYFQYSGRYSHRISSALVISTIFQVCYIMDGLIIGESTYCKTKKELLRYYVCVNVLVILLIVMNYFAFRSNMSDYSWWKNSSEPKLEAINEMSFNKSSYYVMDMFTVQFIHRYKLFETTVEGSMDNMVTSAACYLNTPITKVPMAKYGYENPYDALRDPKGSVYLIDNNYVERKIQFLNEHYGGGYEAQFVEERNGLDIYKVVHSED